jgi:hypothetical protein
MASCNHGLFFSTLLLIACLSVETLIFGAEKPDFWVRYWMRIGKGRAVEDPA